MQRRPQARSQEVQIGKCKLVFENNLEILSTFFFMSRRNKYGTVKIIPPQLYDSND